jgi:alpha-tubulin suppressor-like RCC1 family protein
LVKDFLGKHITMIAAGWNHSLAMTNKGDLYSCGYGQNGQLGLGEKESRTQFTHVHSVGNKNITKLFAGGCHSWVVLDSIVPIKEDYRYPSPTGRENASYSGTPLKKGGA